MAEFSKALDACLDAFEQKWRSGKSPPSLPEFHALALPAIASSDVQVLAMELAMIDLEHRWRRFFDSAQAGLTAHDPCQPFIKLPRWSDYCRLMQLDPLHPAGIRHEYRVRQLFGDRPSFRNFCETYADHAEVLSRDLPSLAAHIAQARIRVFRDNRLLLTTWLPGRIQVGRRRADEPASPCCVQTGDIYRLIVAGNEARHLSRNQLGIEMLARDRVEIFNKTPANRLVIGALSQKWSKPDTVEVALPCTIQFSRWLFDIS